MCPNYPKDIDSVGVKAFLEGGTKEQKCEVEEIL
jgi:hypothetical protein